MLFRHFESHSCLAEPKCRRDEASNSILRLRIIFRTPRLIAMPVNFSENTQFFSMPLKSFLYLLLLPTPYCCVSFHPVVKKSVHPKLDLAFPNCHCVHSSLFVFLISWNIFYILHLLKVWDILNLLPWSCWCHSGIQEQIHGWERSGILVCSLRDLLYSIGQSKQQEQLLNTLT